MRLPLQPLSELPRRLHTRRRAVQHPGILALLPCRYRFRLRLPSHLRYCLRYTGRSPYIDVYKRQAYDFTKYSIKNIENFFFLLSTFFLDKLHNMSKIYTDNLSYLWSQIRMRCILFRKLRNPLNIVARKN